MSQGTRFATIPMGGKPAFSSSSSSPALFGPIGSETLQPGIKRTGIQHPSLFLHNG